MKNPGKKALYEVIGSHKPKNLYGDNLDINRPKEKEPNVSKVQKESIEAKEQVEDVSSWPKKADPVRVNSGRVEFSMPWTALVTIVLVFVLALIGSFRLGQKSDSEDLCGLLSRSSVSKGTKELSATGEKMGDSSIAAAKPFGIVTPREDSGVKPEKGNLVVLAQYAQQRELLPIQKFFATVGVETLIKQSGNVYKLVTKDTYDNPNKSGTDGYAAIQKLKKIGAGYKPPEGYKSFNFKSIYGEKVK